jgi:hypothetical protein
MTPKAGFAALNRPQLALVGGTVGYAMGILAGPTIKALIGLVLIVAFYYVGKHLDNRFEAELGFVGIAAAILATYMLDPLRHAIAGTLGMIIDHTSSFLLAGIGALCALRLQELLLNDSDSDLFSDD